MECSIAALIACFSWSNFYIDTGLEFRDREYQYSHDWEAYRVIESTATEFARYELIDAKRFIETEADNPYARISIGFAFQFSPSVTADLRLAAHESSISTGRDKGENSVSLGVRWFPFRR